ncbi:MAG: ComF family protein [Pseudomonadota bacterium]
MPSHLDRCRRLLEHVLDAVLPRSCLVCGLPLPSDYKPERTAYEAVCAPCAEELPWNALACAQCAAPIDTRVPTETCVACELAPPAWDRAITSLRYAPPVDAMIHRLKFGGSLSDGKFLASALALSLRATRPAREDWPDLITAVPMHPLRRAQRGFNHAAFLAHALSRELPCVIDTDLRALRRARWTPAQAKLDAAARLHNLIDVMRWHGSAPPSHVAVVDDVLTTGATSAAVTAALYQAGAQHVEIWACARAGRFRPGAK